MNKRIKDIWNKAAAHQSERNFDNYSTWEQQVEFLNTFAELIVRECCQAVWSEECNTSDLALEEYNRTVRKIRQYFGVDK